MLTPLVVLWLGAPADLAAHEAAITDYARARGARAVAPQAAGSPRYDARLAEEIEALLERARSEAGDADASALERAEALLLAHPELPQAPWLLGESYALAAQARERAGADAASARELSARAAALEGQRASAAGAEPLPAPPPEPGPPLALAGARPQDRVYVDGVPVRPEAPVAPGRHHVQLLRGTWPVAAAWVEAGVGAQNTLHDPTRACSRLDLAGVQAEPGRPVVAPPGILCQRWAVARQSLSGGTELAGCQGSVCGPWQTMHAALAGGPVAPAAVESDARWPSWLTWSLLGAGAAAATGIVLWQTGAFDTPAPSTEFVFTGPNAAAYSF